MKLANIYILILLFLLTSFFTLVPIGKIDASDLVEQENFEEFKRKVKVYLKEYIGTHEIPGIQLSVKYGTRAFNLAMGETRYGKGRELTVNNLLRIGSVTKIFTAVMVLQDVEFNIIGLNDTIDKWFPEVPNANKIRVKNLLNHTSGIYDYTRYFPFQLKTVIFKNKVWENKELYSYVLKGKPDFEPGKKHLYSNSNYLLLGIILEKVHNKSYIEILKEKIVDPLKLTGTFYVNTSSNIPEGLIPGYDRDVIPFGTHEIEPDNMAWASSGYSAGGIISNSKDLSIFLENLFSYRIISKSTVSRMMDFIDYTDPDIPEQIGYGLGLRKLKVNNDVIIGHTGTIPGFGAAAFYCPEKNYYITFAANKSLLNQGEILMGIINLMN